MLPRIELLIFLFLENKTLRRCRCMCRYPEPDEFKVDATYTCWASHSGWACTLNIQNAIHKFKYRQGNRPAGEHLRVILSIKDSALDANLSAYRTVNLSVICTGFMQVKALFGQCFDFFQNCGQQAFTMGIFLQGLVHRQHFLHQL